MMEWNNTAEHVKMANDLKLSKSIQETLLPEKKGEFGSSTWRTVRRKSSTLSGDWDDIQTYQTKNGERYLAAIVVDVTSHGIASALMLSNIISNWMAWVKALKSGLENNVNLETLVANCPEKINEGLNDMRYCLGASLAIVVHDQTQNKLVYCTAGHPGIMYFSKSKFCLLETNSSLVGIKGGFYRAGIQLCGEDDWKAAIYTDGIIPPHFVVAQWASRVMKSIRRKNDIPFVLNLALTMKKINFEMKVRKSLEEDDMTIVFLGIRKDRRCGD